MSRSSRPGRLNLLTFTERAIVLTRNVNKFEMFVSTDVLKDILFLIYSSKEFINYNIKLKETFCRGCIKFPSPGKYIYIKFVGKSIRYNSKKREGPVPDS